MFHLRRVGSRVLETWKTVPGSRRSITQHRVILVPQIPSDTSENNPILRTQALTNYASVKERDCYYGLGKALLSFESRVAQVEKMCNDGETDFEKILRALEESRIEFETVWNNVNMLLLTTDLLERDLFSKLHLRAEKALQQRHDSLIIYNTLKSIHSQKDKLSEELQQVLDRYLLECKLQGLDLPPKKNLAFRETFIPNLTTNLGDYNYKMQRSTNRFHHTIVDPSLVSEYPLDVLRAISSDSSQPSKGPWTITLHPYIYRKFMEYCPDRRLRWNAYLASVNRGSKDFDPYLAVTTNLKNILKTRWDIAVTLGFQGHLDLSLQTKMANNVENVETMIGCLLPPAKAAQEKELEGLQDLAESQGFDEDLAHYDIGFFKRKQRKNILGGLSDEDLRVYFPLSRVLKTVFNLCEEMFRIKIEPVPHDEALKSKGFNPWNKDVHFYRVVDSDGLRVLGEFYFDPYIRDDKIYTGADKGFYFPLRNKSDSTKGSSLGSVVMSLPLPAYGKPSLLNFSEVEEVFRTLGRMLAHTLNQQTWADLSSQHVEEDTFEVIPEYMTHWLYMPKVLRSLCAHWSTGEGPDEAIFQGLLHHRRHLAGLELSEELLKASFDMTLYGEDPMKESYMDIIDRMYPEYLLIPREKEDNFPLYFEDIIARKHPGSYYGRTWSKMIAADAFHAIHEASESETANVSMRFREHFLNTGGFLPYAEKFRRYRGRDPSHEALFLSLGLKEESTSPKYKSQE
eukprot:TRINITY_DN6508_c0_g1_i1.p1 TRINITY_DN6508_c0_g1~~TRINITY_DN6508_c0_g1_i1.p1  ORF type:complete len:740 (+),score=236.52 TRINITY_DN6508_c0_g1_i1:24-2243(+)